MALVVFRREICKQINVFKNPIIVTKCLSNDAKKLPEDISSHTGQKFEKEDYRLARFVDREKQVNTQYAIKLIDEVPPQPKKDRIVFCDGGGGPLGHPRVYINLDKPGNHTCGYCGLRFYKDGHH